MTLDNAEILKDYTIVNVVTDDEELNSFLFSLGCYNGETITIIRKTKSNMVIALKDGRYSIDSQLAKSITVE